MNLSSKKTTIIESIPVNVPKERKLYFRELTLQISLERKGQVYPHKLNLAHLSLVFKKNDSFGKKNNKSAKLLSHMSSL